MASELLYKELPIENLMRMTFQVTDACNLRCSYCYEKEKSNHFMKIDDAKVLINKLCMSDERYFNGYFSRGVQGVQIDFIGGEIGLCMGIVDDITSYFCKQACRFKPQWIETFRICLQTNGTTYFNTDFQDYLKKYGSKVELSLSLDGNKECHNSCRVYANGKGSFDDVFAAAKDYLNRGKQPNTKLTVSPNNVMYVFDSVKELFEMGYRYLRIGHVYENVWNSETEEAYGAQMMAVASFAAKVGLGIMQFDDDNFVHDEMNICFGCGANGSSIAIDWTGKLYSCFRFSECSIPHREPYIIGTAAQGITERHRVNELCSTKRYKNKECENCKINSGCGWCAAFNYDHTGDVSNSLNTWCNMYKLTHRAYLQYKKIKAEVVNG